MPELLLGCGNSRTKIMGRSREWSDLTTLDMDGYCKPDVIYDLMSLPLPFEPDTFDEIHAYHVLEHTGQQGDWRWFFAQWSDIWRILKPGGYFMGIVPEYPTEWSWGDPGHTRIISRACLTFLVQPEYTQQIGVTAMCDYRHAYAADFDIVHSSLVDKNYEFVIKAIKPSRITRAG